jgi:mono/diheme cytochrome c family protein
MLHRPLAAGVGAVGVLSVGALTAIAVATTPPTSATERGVQLNSTQIVGRSLFQANCTGCHGVNLQGVDGPPLTRVGTLRDASYVHLYIENPKELNTAAKMPAFIPPPGIPPRLTHDQVEAITEYLMTFH